MTMKKLATSFWLVWLVVAAVVIAKAAFIYLTPIRGLASTTWIIDDSLIEMRIAQNIAQGNGFSLDGIHSTTGAPFLWIYLSSLNHMVSGLDGAIRLTLLETTLLGALAAAVVFFLSLKLTQDRRIAWTSFLLVTFTGNAFFNGLNGMDTSLFTLLALLAIASFFEVGRPTRMSDFAWGGIVGLFAGLMCMTRGDGIFVVGAIGFVRLIQLWQADRPNRRRLLLSTAGMLLAWGICFALFMGWQLWQTGSPFPANQVGRRVLAYAKHNFSFDAFSWPRYVAIVAWNVFQLEELLRIAMGSFLLALTGFVAGLLRRDLRPLALLTGSYLLVFYGLLVTYQWYFADFHGLRYVNVGVHLLLIFVAALFWQLPAERLKTAAVTFLALSVIVVSGYKYYQLSSRMPWAGYTSFIGRPNPELNRQFWGTIDWIRDNIPAGTVVGVRDYGRISLFTSIAVQDLAGNIDPMSPATLAAGTLDEYLKTRNVQYLFIPSLSQRDDLLYQFLHKNLDLEIVKAAPPSPFQTLYKINW